jgi:hypothetical protein
MLLSFDCSPPSFPEVRICTPEYACRPNPLQRVTAPEIQNQGTNSGSNAVPCPADTFPQNELALPRYLLSGRLVAVLCHPSLLCTHLITGNKHRNQALSHHLQAALGRQGPVFSPISFLLVGPTGRPNERPITRQPMEHPNPDPDSCSAQDFLTGSTIVDSMAFPRGAPARRRPWRKRDRRVSALERRALLAATSICKGMGPDWENRCARGLARFFATIWLGGNASLGS